jgi:hypothetical protein
MRYLLLKTMDDGHKYCGNYDIEDFCDKLVEAINSRLRLQGVRCIEFEVKK